MPKEIAHFALAEEVGRNLPRNSLFFDPVQKFSFLFLLGAVTPDTPFCYLAGPKKKHIQALSRPFHQAGAGALMPVLNFLDKDRTPEALALAAGVVCHIMSDTTFHPLVYYYAGMDNIHNGATARHRYFETAMDIHFRHIFRGKTNLFKIVRRAEISGPKLNGLFKNLYGEKRLSRTILNYTIGWHVLLQYLFGADIPRVIASQRASVSSPLPPPVAGLVYPFNKPCALAFFSNSLFFKHPCTKTRVSTTLTSLIQQAVTSTLSVLAVMEQAMAQSRGDQQNQKTSALVFENKDLPDVSPDLPAERFTTWHQQHDIRPLIYQGQPILF